LEGWGLLEGLAICCARRGKYRSSPLHAGSRCVSTQTQVGSLGRWCHLTRTAPEPPVSILRLALCLDHRHVGPLSQRTLTCGTEPTHRATGDETPSHPVQWMWTPPSSSYPVGSKSEGKNPRHRRRRPHRPGEIAVGCSIAGVAHGGTEGLSLALAPSHVTPDCPISSSPPTPVNRIGLIYCDFGTSIS
jgi:hypothetical protein